MRKTIWLLLLIFVFITTSFAVTPHAEARRRRRRVHHKSHLKIINEKKLYERLGGAGALNSITDEWVRTSISDPRMAGIFAPLTAKPEKLAHFRHGLNDGLCEVSDGPCGEKSENKIPGGLVLNDEQFLMFADNLSHTLQKHGVAERERDELLSRMTEIKPDFMPETHGRNSASLN